MFDHLPHTELQTQESMGDQIPSYIGVSHTPDKDCNLTDIYSDSATIVKPCHELVGEADRIL